MAARKKVKPAMTKQTRKPKAAVPVTQETAAGEPEMKTQTRPKTKNGPARRRPRVKPAKRKRTAPKGSVRRPRRVQKRRRGRYSGAERARILTAAAAQKLTAQQVHQRFGVRPATYYSWRKKAKATGKRAPRQLKQGGPKGVGLAGLVRENIQDRLRGMLPEIVRGEVAAYLKRAFKKAR